MSWLLLAAIVLPLLLAPLAVPSRAALAAVLIAPLPALVGL
jgi:hypothetical protein